MPNTSKCKYISHACSRFNSSRSLPSPVWLQPHAFPTEVALPSAPPASFLSRSPHPTLRPYRRATPDGRRRARSAHLGRDQPQEPHSATRALYTLTDGTGRRLARDPCQQSAHLAPASPGPATRAQRPRGQADAVKDRAGRATPRSSRTTVVDSAASTPSPQHTFCPRELPPWDISRSTSSHNGASSAACLFKAREG